MPWFQRLVEALKRAGGAPWRGDGKPPRRRLWLERAAAALALAALALGAWSLSAGKAAQSRTSPAREAPAGQDASLREARDLPGPDTVPGRFPPPPGFQRMKYPSGGFAEYLRALPLKRAGEPVRYFDGGVKPKDVHVAVYDIPLLDEDLIQCADAAIKLRAEYLFSQGRLGEIGFEIGDGTKVWLNRFVAGYRPVPKGETIGWRRVPRQKVDRALFDDYLTFIYRYAGSWSLSRELRRVPLDEIEVGDLFVEGGFPGHVVTVVDLAVEAGTGRKAMLLAQGYMPSQDLQLLKSPDPCSPWYHVEDGELETPEWRFPAGSLMRW